MTKIRRGFTFIELIMAVLIFSIVSLSIYYSFNLGIRAWQKADSSYRNRQEARYLLGLLSRELRTANNSKTIMFRGGADSVSFCKAANGLFKVSYSYDAGERAVYRVLQTYKENANSQPGIRSRLASGISGFNLKFSYKKDGKIEWDDLWEEEKGDIPYGVKVFLAYSPIGVPQPVVISETILIPTGILKEKEEK